MNIALHIKAHKEYTPIHDSETGARQESYQLPRHVPRDKLGPRHRVHSDHRKGAWQDACCLLCVHSFVNERKSDVQRVTSDTLKRSPGSESQISRGISPAFTSGRRVVIISVVDRTLGAQFVLGSDAAECFAETLAYEVWLELESESSDAE
jgi:hypothetical protein